MIVKLKGLCIFECLLSFAQRCYHRWCQRVPSPSHAPRHPSIAAPVYSQSSNTGPASTYSHVGILYYLAGITRTSVVSVILTVLVLRSTFLAFTRKHSSSYCTVRYCTVRVAVVPWSYRTAGGRSSTTRRTRTRTVRVEAFWTDCAYPQAAAHQSADDVRIIGVRYRTGNVSQLHQHAPPAVSPRRRPLTDDVTTNGATEVRDLGPPP